MIDPVQALLERGMQAPDPFPPESRYHGVPVATTKAPDGRTIAYVRRRFVPRPEDQATMGEHVVTGSDRLDTIAARYFGDPEQFWRICDANRGIRPQDLVVPGSRLRIALPPGIPGASR